MTWYVWLLSEFHKALKSLDLLLYRSRHPGCEVFLFFVPGGYEAHFFESLWVPLWLLFLHKVGLPWIGHDLRLLIKNKLIVQVLTPPSIAADSSVMISLAWLRFELLMQVDLLPQFLLAMGERALVPILTVPIELLVLAHFRLEFQLVTQLLSLNLLLLLL